MPEPEVGSVPFKEALEHFRNKKLVDTRAWDQMRAEEHAKAFTVAGATKQDVLGDIYESIERIQREGGTIADFRKDFDKIVADKGWSYNGKRGWRTRTIFDTNLRTSQAAGRWEQIQRRQRALQKRRPNETLYLIYSTVGDLRVREAHRAWHHTVLPVDDPFWDSHYPPNGWGCRCIVRTASKRTLDREGLKVSERPEISFEDRINSKTGQVYKSQIKGIDTSWNYNVGKAHVLGPQEAFGLRLARMDPAIASAALSDASGILKSFETTYMNWAGELITKKRFRQGERRGLGYMSFSAIETIGKEVKDIALPANPLITIEDNQVLRMARPAKRSPRRRAEIALTDEDIKQLPSKLANPRAILFDQKSPAFLYIFEPADDPKGRLGKFVIPLDFFRNGVMVYEGRSSGKVQADALDDKKRYQLIEGEL